MAKLSFNSLIIHTDAIRSASSLIVEKHRQEWNAALNVFSEFYEELERTTRSTARNVKMLLSTRFFNHVYSALKLVECGLVADAVVCERSAIESLAGYKLVCSSPEMAEKYNNGKFPKPIEVRKKLEQLGYLQEVENIRGIYSQASGITHLNRDHERFSMDWETNKNGVLYIGGNYNENDIKHMIEFLPSLIHWFLMPMEKSANKANSADAKSRAAD